MNLYLLHLLTRLSFANQTGTWILHNKSYYYGIIDLNIQELRLYTNFLLNLTLLLCLFLTLDYGLLFHKTLNALNI